MGHLKMSYITLIDLKGEIIVLILASTIAHCGPLLIFIWAAPINQRMPVLIRP